MDANRSPNLRLVSALSAVAGLVLISILLMAGCAAFWVVDA